ncbi:MAG: CpsD/CapB family tyrosine-protein kinase [Desulfobacterales bacterium]|nr:CpsD/CapB family tyrosine-protein kinase [Desulfobacterales bacterium]
MLKDTYDEPDQIEEELKAPVLGVIPWLDKQTYNEPNALLAIDDSASFYSLAYQMAVSSLRIRAYNTGAKTFVFSSAEFSKSRSTILMNMAHGLNRAGRSVVVVDADFRTPCIHKEFGLQANEQFNLTELLTNITRELRENGEFNWKYLSYFTQELPESKNLFVISNIGNVSDPNEFLYSNAFNALIQKLKEQYDWVLIDTPPVLAVPDALTTSSYGDGMVLITGIETTKTNLRKISKTLSNYHIPVFGVIARKAQTKEAVLSNEYIKQMISNMVPEDVMIKNKLNLRQRFIIGVA